MDNLIELVTKKQQYQNILKKTLLLFLVRNDWSNSRKNCHLLNQMLNDCDKLVLQMHYRVTYQRSLHYDYPSYPFHRLIHNNHPIDFFHYHRMKIFGKYGGYVQDFYEYCFHKLNMLLLLYCYCSCHCNCIVIGMVRIRLHALACVRIRPYLSHSSNACQRHSAPYYISRYKPQRLCQSWFE